LDYEHEGLLPFFVKKNNFGVIHLATFIVNFSLM
jgi:hypothetical protein